MIVHRIVDGFVLQVFDTETKQFISQEFVAGASAEYQTPDGNDIDADELPEDIENLGYEMVQPEQDNMSTFEEDLEDWLEGERGA